ncbi:hypothetical protein A1A1_07639 [Planococcus antarcticus DSM 14505]|uniref:Lipoprotein SmpA/OmlA domain-containing protein n=1 Tax=Planococcus antarcticus DSM 14505 TaxID=1185653 RepID=A0A1C7DHU0_9BACL|nr:hypothetical protein [Planococcus antarcticus]ANU11035.1 hypothetical protein BBH88_12345 [Planococcus antarcticus DSM 14505]EIM07032.1 hypothetical protein A1A1_07639 [Planococcus antarcticus DSM 14505]
MRLSGQDMEAKLRATNYTDSQLMKLNYDHSKHLVTMNYMGQSDTDREERKYTVFFKSGFLAKFDVW